MAVRDSGAVYECVAVCAIVEHDSTAVWLCMCVCVCVCVLDSVCVDVAECDTGCVNVCACRCVGLCVCVRVREVKGPGWQCVCWAVYMCI